MNNTTDQNHQSDQPNPTPATSASGSASPEPANVVEVDPEAAIVTGTEDSNPVTVVVNPPKKSKLGLIVAIVVLILFLIGGGCLAYWYFGVYNKPENVALDATKNFITAPSITTSGKISITTPQAGHNDISVVIEFNNASNRLPDSTTAKLSISERDSQSGEIIDNHEVSINLGTTIMKDGVIYFQISHLRESFDLIVEESDERYDKEWIEIAEEVIDLIDNEWWRISVADLVEEIAGEDTATKFTETYECILNVASSYDRSEIAAIYTRNPFAKVQKTDQEATEAGSSVYELTIDNDAYAGFVNALPTSNLAESLYACYNNTDPRAEISAEDFDPITGADVSEVIPEDFKILATITDGSHRLKGLKFSNEDITGTFEVDLNFDYVETVVSAPESYRDITELVDDISEIIYSAISELDPEVVDELIEQTL